MNPRIGYAVLIAAIVCFLIAAILERSIVALGLFFWSLSTIPFFATRGPN